MLKLVGKKEFAKQPTQHNSARHSLSCFSRQLKAAALLLPLFHPSVFIKLEQQHLISTDHPYEVRFQMTRSTHEFAKAPCFTANSERA